ncbi:DUF1302 domain-containing protein [Solimonas terrae]|uniref:DUF1302 domain-containing protein n=1 Tax=Solimonas terrae TaxID=1396819 RepID=A0A6M2BQ37_9GAMM|nr:DUF1302 family protein [Solimonas terrae]NGY04464.1 DUF1302 domain-containing protein [Solimonas terrae]
MHNQNAGWRAPIRRAGAATALLFAVGLSASANASSFDVFGVDGSFKLTTSYGVGIRTEKQAKALIDGPIDPFVIDLSGAADGAAFLHTGLPTTINSDDGNRNFDRGSLVNNRISALGELQLNYDNYGAVFSGDAFYDWVYHESNDNDSPDTINKTGSVNHFTRQARHFDGQRVRLLEAYAFGDWDLADTMHLNLRAGRQLVAWGESLFFSGIALAQGRADATKAIVPGAEVKEILLPTNQISLNFGLTSNLSLLGYYKLEFAETEIFPVGDFFSPTDAIGPGGSFVYGSVNPLALNSCTGVLTSLIAGIPALGPTLGNLLGAANVNPDNLCMLNGLGETLVDAPPYVIPTRGKDIRPSDYGQYGVGMRYQLDEGVVGAYYLRYADSNPTVQLNFGYSSFSDNPLLKGVLTTQLFGQQTPTSYQVKYYGGIDMYALSYSTLLGPVNVAGEASFRHGIDTAAQAIVSGVLTPIFTRADIGQAQVSAIYATNPGLLFDDIALVGEAGIVHVFNVDKLEARPGLFPVGDGDKPFYSRTSYAFQTLMIPTRRNAFPGWNLSVPISFGMLVKGTPAMAGAFGALYGDGDTRLSVGVTADSINSLTVGVAYNMFFGDASKTIGHSTLPANPFVDHDYATFNVKYSF